MSLQDYKVHYQYDEDLTLCGNNVNCCEIHVCTSDTKAVTCYVCLRRIELAIVPDEELL
jgi:hypothetical protein